MDEPSNAASAPAEGDPFVEERLMSEQAPLSEPVAPKKGVARLSVNVNLDVPADYRTREFVSVADAVHAPSVLSVVVQRRSQIAAVRFCGFDRDHRRVETSQGHDADEADRRDCASAEFHRFASAGFQHVAKRARWCRDRQRGECPHGTHLRLHVVLFVR